MFHEFNRQILTGNVLLRKFVLRKFDPESSAAKSLARTSFFVRSSEALPQRLRSPADDLEDLEEVPRAAEEAKDAQKSAACSTH